MAYSKAPKVPEASAGKVAKSPRQSVPEASNGRVSKSATMRPGRLAGSTSEGEYVTEHHTRRWKK